MRIRTIKPEFFKNDALAELPPLARLLFIGLWCLADRRGRLEDRPKRIQAEILPYEPKADCNALLGKLAEAGFITRYEVGGNHIIQINTFEQHQRLTGKETETESKLPPPPKSGTGETTGKHPGSTREASGSPGREGKGKERKGREGEGEEERSEAAVPPPPPPPDIEPFEDWKTRLGLKFPGLDIDAELRAAQAKRKTLGVPRRWFEEHWLPNADQPEDIVAQVRPGKPEADPPIPEPEDPLWRDRIAAAFPIDEPEELADWAQLTPGQQTAYTNYLKKQVNNS